MRALRVRRAVIASSLVAVSGIALGAPGVFSVVVDAPPGAVDVVDVAAGMAGSDTITLDNVGGAAGSITSIDADTCDPGVTATPAVALPVALAPGDKLPVVIGCSAFAPFTIRRCQFHARDNGAPVVDFAALCATDGTSALGVSAPSLDYGNVGLGSAIAIAVTLTNTSGSAFSTLALQLDDQDGNFRLGAPCFQDGPGCTANAVVMPGASTTVQVSCTPAAMGALAASLFAVADNGARAPAIALTCAGAGGGSGPQLSLDRSAVGVLGADVDGGTATGSLHVTNTGGSDLHVASIVPTGGFAGDWSATASGACATTPCTVAAGQSFDIAIAFDPGALGRRDSTLQITSDDVQHPTTNVGLTGTGLGATLALDTILPATGLDLGSVPVGASASATIALRNDGNLDLAPATLDVTPPDGFSLDTPMLAIPASSSATVTVTCTPTAAQMFASVIAVHSDDALSGSPLSIPVTCEGTTGDLQAAPQPIQLGEIRTGSGVHTTTITLASVDAQTVDLGDAPSLVQPVTGMSVSATSAAQVTSAAPATFTLAVDPKGDLDLTTQIAVPAGGSSTLAIPVSGRVVTAAVTVPATRQLGSFCVDQPTTTTTLSLTASGTATIALDEPAMAGGSTSPFEVERESPVAYPFALPAKQTATVSVTPLRQSAGGTQTDQLVWTTDVDSDPAPATMMSADFISDGGAIAPGSIDYDPVPIHLPVANDQLVTIQNCGADDMTLAAPTITPTGAFHLDGPEPPSSLAPTQSATLTIGFAPIAKGPFDAQLVVTSSKGDLVVALHGEGTVSGTGPGDDDMPPASSGCGCDSRSTDPAGVLALAAAVALSLSRRKRGATRTGG